MIDPEHDADYVASCAEAAAIAHAPCEHGLCGFGPYGCCDRKFCDATYAGLKAANLHERFPYDPTQRLPYLTPQGCALPPHYRPNCATYLCPYPAPWLSLGCEAIVLASHQEKAHAHPFAKHMDTHIQGVKVQLVCVPLRPPARGRRLPMHVPDIPEGDTPRGSTEDHERVDSTDL